MAAPSSRIAASAKALAWSSPCRCKHSHPLFDSASIKVCTRILLRDVLVIRLLAVTGMAMFCLAMACGQTPPSAPAAPQAQPAPVVLTLADALARAKTNSPQFQAAVTELGVAREDRYQSRASLLPGVDYNNSFIYTQGNGTASGRYIANNGVHEYISQGSRHETIGPAEVLDFRRTAAAHALAKARAEIAARGLIVTVVQAFYGLLAAQPGQR